MQIKKFLLKLWWCKIWRFHDFDSPAQRKEECFVTDDMSEQEIVEAFWEFSKMTCKHCDHVSEIWKEWKDKSLATYK